MIEWESFVKVQFNQSLHLSDTLIPDVFISEFMSKLSGDAIRAYLFITQNYQHGNRKMTMKELAQRLDCTEKSVEKALSELQFLNLILIQSGYLEIVDIKYREIEKLLTNRKHDSNVSKEDISKRELIIKQINDTFFQGMMSLGFYTKIDEWFTKYEFEPEVLYAIFSEAAGKNKLDGPGYVAGIADNWAKNGVKTYRQLNLYYKQYEELRKLINQVKSKLNAKGNFSVYQEELIAKWKNDFGYDFSIIELALKSTINLNNPNLKYIDRILTNWHELQLHSVEEVTDYLLAYKKNKQNEANNSKRQTQHRKLKSDELKDLDVQEEELYNAQLMQFLEETKDDMK